MALRRRLVVTTAGVLVATVMAAGCGDGGEGVETSDGSVLQVVAGFARLAEVAERVGGDRVEVRDLTPAGAEPHDLELSTDDIDAVEDADVMLSLGGDFQPAISRAARRADRNIDLLRADETEDPHIWLDPVRFSQVATDVGEALAAADPAGAEDHRRRAAELKTEVEGLHRQYEAGLRTCRRRILITAHAAFGRLADRYGLDQRAITGISPEAEPDPRRLAELADLARREGITHIFNERLVSPRVARALAREAGVEVAVLDPLEGRLREGYAAAMRKNLETLRRVLDCE